MSSESRLVKGNADQVYFYLIERASHDLTGHALETLNNKLGFVDQLPPFTRVAFDPERFEILISSVRGELKVD